MASPGVEDDVIWKNTTADQPDATQAKARTALSLNPAFASAVKLTANF